MNVCIFTGRLVKTPELKTTTSQKSVTTFTLAVNSGNRTDFVDCVAWQKTAEFICKYFGKGQMIAVETEYNKREYDKDGQKRYAHEFIVVKADFCSNKADNNSSNNTGNTNTPPAQQNTQNNANFVDLGDDDDLPF